MTKDEFMRRANNLSLLQGDVDALFGELDRLRARASEDADRLHKAVAEVERDEARDAYKFRGGYVEDASGDRWWSAGLLSKVDQERDAARAEVSLENVTAERDEARAEVERLQNDLHAYRAIRRQLLARLRECRPWVGVCPFPNTREFSEMVAVRDLADDTLDEVGDAKREPTVQEQFDANSRQASLRRRV
jgi:hypothetical protein